MYPPDSGKAVVPAGMADYLLEGWTYTFMSGNWEWDYQVSGITAGISFVDSIFKDPQMINLDKGMDDGNLGTGGFQKLAGRYTYILE